MKRAFSHSPVAIKLGLRDLKNNPIATGVLIVILSIVLGYAVSAFIKERTGWASSFMHDQHEIGMVFSAFDAASDTPNQPTLDMFVRLTEELSTSIEPPTEFTQFTMSQSDVALLSDTISKAIETYPITATVDDAPIYASQGSETTFQGILGLSADWSRPEISGLLTLETGRLPNADNEIAVASGKPESYVRRHDSYRDSSFEKIRALKIGDSITLTTGVKTRTYSVVGTFTPTIQRLTGDILFSHNVGMVERSERPLKHGDDWVSDESSKYSDVAVHTPQERLYLLPSGHLTDTQALNLVVALTAESGDGGFGLRQLGENPSLALEAFDLRTQADAFNPVWNLSQASILLAIGLLTLVMVLSFPLYAHSHRRRTIELAQLQRAGAGPRAMLLSRFVPALVIGSMVSAFAIAGNAILMHKGNPYLGWEGIAHTHAYLYIIVFSVVGAFSTTLIPAMAASIYAHVTANTPVEHIHNPDGIPLDFRSASPSTVQRLVLPIVGVTLIIAGFTLMVLSATTTPMPEADFGYEQMVYYPLLGLFCGAILILIGVYLAIPSMIRGIAWLMRQRSLPQRYAARELAARPIVTAHSVLPLALLMTIGVVFNSIAQQHDREEPQYYDQWSYIFEVSISIAIPLCVVAILMLVYGGLLSREEIELSRAPLSRQGLNPHELRRIDMFRGIYVAGVSAALALILGTFTGVILMYYRAEYSQGDPVSVAAWLPSYPTLIAVILPLALSPLIGSLIGRRHARIAMQST